MFPCPCCGHLTLDEAPGSYGICPICYWEDDLVQLRLPSFAGGANKNTLLACERRFITDCRPPTSRDARDPSWRPIDPSTDHFEPAEAPPGIDYGNTYPRDLTTLYYWRATFWRRPT